jgi:hypothetical protein
VHRRELVHFSEIIRCSWLIARLFPRPTRTKRCSAGVRYLALAAVLGFAPFAAPEPASAGPKDADIDAMLDAAEAAERREHFIYPAHGSAMSIYHDVLFSDPENTHAQAGLTRLAEHYLVQAQTALNRDQLLKADSMVSKARMIYPDYPPVETMAHQIALVESAARTRETLDWRLVAERSQVLTPKLQRLGGIAKAGDCRVTINVSNDAEGRWVFQQLNSAPGDARVRAQVKIASPAAVDILCFEDPVNAD